MRTITYDIKSCSEPEFIKQKLDDHAYCTRLVYKMLEESSDPDLLIYLKNRFSLTDIELRSIVCKAKQMRDSFVASLKRATPEIEDLEAELAELQDKLAETKQRNITKTSVKNVKILGKKIHKLKKKIAMKKRFLDSDIVFGSKKLLRKISYLSNDKITNEAALQQVKAEYRRKRKGSIFLMGEANQKGNRYFDFDLKNKTIIYKPFKGKKVEIKLCNRKDKKESLIQEMIDAKLLSVSVSMTEGRLDITYDEATLAGYAINKAERKEEAKDRAKFALTKEEHTAIVKQVYSEYYDRIDKRKLENKLENRYLGIDLNPEYIGYTIMDKLPNRQFKVIQTGCFDFKKLTKKSGESSNHELSVYMNNKRKHERKEAICQLFKLMNHYHVGNFIMEDLNFKGSTYEERKEFNRKVKNIWDRELISKLITKKCTEGGFLLRLVNPVYTSLIGNLSYRVFDPVAASVEITRRGAEMYDKGCFYPNEKVSTIRTMEAIAKRNGIDVGLIRDISWQKRHTIFKEFRYRWGKSAGISEVLSLRSRKSRTVQRLYCLG